MAVILPEGVPSPTGSTSVDDPVQAGTSEAELAARLRLAVTRLSRQLRQVLDSGVTQSQLSALASIERLGAPTLGALAATEQVQPPSMTRLVDGLLAVGLVAREVDAVDRRVARVSLTATGRRVLQRNRSLRTSFMVRRLKRLDPAQREHLAELVCMLEELVRE